MKTISENRFLETIKKPGDLIEFDTYNGGRGTVNDYIYKMKKLAQISAVTFFEDIYCDPFKHIPQSSVRLLQTKYYIIVSRHKT